MGQRFAVVLAAGKGTRMKSKKPKVLHPVCGKPMLQYIIDQLMRVEVHDIVVVVGYGAEDVRSRITGNVTFVKQEEQLGTAHAVLQSESVLKGKEGTTVVMNGDGPLLTEDTLRAFFEAHEKRGAAGTIMTAEFDDPFGYGRIVRGASGDVSRIVEEKDATDEERKIKEVNTGTYGFDNRKLFAALHQVDNQNAQGEYYITDLVEILKRTDTVQTYRTENPEETFGINDRADLARAEAIMRRRINERHMLNGVTLIAPEQTFIGPDVRIGMDTIIHPGTTLSGETEIGENCVIGPHTEMVDAVIGNNVRMKQSVIVESVVKDDCVIGPFAYIRPGCEIDKGVKVGDFVEVKNSKIGPGSKLPHLSYVGDADVGSGVNVGCGAITVNYDGVKKHRTVIEDDAFIGCNTNLVAPVRVGKSAYTAAGSTINKDVPDDALAIARERQVNKERYAAKLRRKKR